MENYLPEWSEGINSPGSICMHSELLLIIIFAYVFNLHNYMTRNSAKQNSNFRIKTKKGSLNIAAKYTILVYTKSCAMMLYLYRK